MALLLYITEPRYVCPFCRQPCTCGYNNNVPYQFITSQKDAQTKKNSQSDKPKKLEYDYSEAVTHPVNIKRVNHDLKHRAKQISKFQRKAFSHRRV